MNYHLGAKLDISSVSDLRRQWIDALIHQNTIVFDGGDVVKVDAAGIQLLAAFARSLREADKEISWREQSVTLQEGLTQLGFHELLMVSKGTEEGSHDANIGGG
ncbi:STAS domain-containing protein [Vibrio sp. SM6]|uniref:STAS domain-containing protein n=1 Tax=Vibrio agarilyticus TaxID=2726741 RepID=A0A7X8TND5_9VIBR|nr:STAS domain-containing protein [Vibrio agarilyticus]NLS11928.1 STAS domain-containing protein [Vibrio agarilyticus]